MGDYTKNNAKIGTCGNAYYATLPMLEAIKHENSEEVNYYLDPSKSCSFAFPFPEYDGKKIGEISNFHEGERVDFFIQIKNQKNTFHKKIVTHLHPKEGQGINLFCDCPYHSKENVSHNFNDENVKFRLVNQLYFKGSLAIAGECIYCGETNIFDEAEALEVCENLKKSADYYAAEANKKEYQGKVNKEINENKAIYYTQIANRILKTYL